MWLTLLALTGLVQAADLEHRLVWDVSVGGTKVGTRELTIKYIREDNGPGMRRILESWTQLDGAMGPIRMSFRQRMTAHSTGHEPASFHSVVEENGSPLEVQARWTPAAWWVTTTTSGRSRTVDMPLHRIDLSTADLLDPDSRFPLSHFQELRLLSAESGEVVGGTVSNLGVQTLEVGGTELQVHGYAWDSTQGRAEFWYSPDGFLVQSSTPLLGVEMVATLQRPPPGGVDDFPVAVGRPAVEILDL